MVKRIYGFSISIMLLFAVNAAAQDTITVPLKIRAGFDVAGPLINFINQDLISYGALGSFDYHESLSLVAGARYCSFSSEEDTYDFSSRGLSFVLGADYNFIKPKVSAGKYYAGLGLRLGISFYGQEASRIQYTNPWGTGESAVPFSRHTGSYLEFTPGVRTELFPGFTIGWNLYLRMLLGAGTGDGPRPVYMPGYGPGSSKTATGAAYYISISIPYRNKRVIIKPKPVSEDSGTEERDDSQNTGSSSSSFSSR